MTISAALHLAYLIFSSTSESMSPNTLSNSKKFAAATKFLAVFLLDGAWANTGKKRMKCGIVSKWNRTACLYCFVFFSKIVFV